MEECKCTKEGEIATLRAENKTIFKEIDNLKNIQNTILELSTNITRLVEQMRETKEDVKIIRDDLDEIKKTPSSDLQYYKKLIIGGVITIILGFLIGKLL
ncbi:hypothetical protein CIW83_06320 [Tissierella sp. P1]|jgi:predicted  nucleic acid-binding Zn-ribbon protein|uniref:hypothetical protein n=1 Tax=Tissierella TaxID=41273 RepID=UPI000B9FF40D|nr:hypothetical protein [Tissierella sp. P1]MDU5083164.1 hypothetical protein [Bacillota bacterium]OZV12833.1 hypothetical protein CIW83_06320 [Tissierella sp. P1]